MFVVCGAIGLPISQLLPARFAWRACVAPTLGYGVLAVAVPVAYRMGVSITQFFYASVAVAAIVLALTVRRVVIGDRRVVGAIAGVCLAATLVMMAPRWLGGDRFSAFQGNTWDTYGYLESAIVYANESYADVVAATDAEYVRNPMLAMGQASLVNRPSVHQLYGVFSRVAPGQSYRLYHPFLVFSLAQFVLVALFVLRTLFPARSFVACAAVAVTFPLGFWGQYIFDINAWSHISAIPSLFLIFGLAIDLAVHEETDARAGMRLAGVLAVAIAGALFLYPEGFVVYIAAAAPIAGVPSIVRAIRGRRWVGLIPLAGIAGLASAIVYKPTWDFLVLQLTHSKVMKVSWWEYFQIFLFGRDGDAGPTAIDFPAGFAGLYFATPTVKASAAMAVGSRVAIVLVIVAILATLGALIAGRFSDALPDTRKRIIAWTAGSVLLLVPAVILFVQESYWPAGKCISYAAPVFVTLFCLPVAATFTSRPLRIARWLVVGYVAFQLLTSFVRVHAARKHGHYARPYPGVLDPGLKKFLPWDFSPFEAALDESTRVLVRVPDVWPRAHVLVFLYARHVPFAIEGPVNTYFDGGKALGPLPPPWEPDVELVQEPGAYVLKFRDGRAPVRIVAKR